MTNGPWSTRSMRLQVSHGLTSNPAYRSIRSHASPSTPSGAVWLTRTCRIAARPPPWLPCRLAAAITSPLRGRRTPPFERVQRGRAVDIDFLPDSSRNNLDDRCRGASAAGEADRCVMCCCDAASPDCPRCDDPLFFDVAPSRPDIDPRHCVLVAHTGQVDPSRGEICLLPFRVSLITSRLTWCRSQLVLVGSREVPSVEIAWQGQRTRRTPALAAQEIVSRSPGS